jgi:hypothetical protein
MLIKLSEGFGEVKEVYVQQDRKYLVTAQGTEVPDEDAQVILENYEFIKEVEEG